MFKGRVEKRGKERNNEFQKCFVYSREVNILGVLELLFGQRCVRVVLLDLGVYFEVVEVVVRKMDY